MRSRRRAMVEARLEDDVSALVERHHVAQPGHGCMDRLLVEPLWAGQPDAALGQWVKDSGPKRPQATKAAMTK